MCDPGGAAALGSPYGGAGERSEPERAQAVANLGKCVDCDRVSSQSWDFFRICNCTRPLSHGFQP